MSSLAYRIPVDKKLTNMTAQVIFESPRVHDEQQGSPHNGMNESCSRAGDSQEADKPSEPPWSHPRALRQKAVFLPARNSRSKTKQVVHRSAFSCCFCGARLASVSALLRHLTTPRRTCRTVVTSPGRSTQCAVCAAYPVVDRAGYAAHLRDHHPGVSAGERLVCDTCGKTFSTRGHLKEHWRRLHDPGAASHECDKCGASFTSKSDLNTHATRQHGPPRFECSLCGARLKRRDALELHLVRAHNARTPHLCPQCGVQFISAASLAHHQRRAHAAPPRATGHPGDNQNEVHECDVCGKTFKCDEYLRSHYKTHSNSKPTEYSCGICHKKFHREYFVLIHLATEHKAGPSVRSKCPVCAREFSYPPALGRHLKLHELRPHQCPHCHRVFAYRNNLTVHASKCAGRRVAKAERKQRPGGSGGGECRAVETSGGELPTSVSGLATSGAGVGTKKGGANARGGRFPVGGTGVADARGRKRTLRRSKVSKCAGCGAVLTPITSRDHECAARGKDTSCAMVGENPAHSAGDAASAVKVQSSSCSPSNLQLPPVTASDKSPTCPPAPVLVDPHAPLVIRNNPSQVPAPSSRLASQELPTQTVDHTPSDSGVTGLISIPEAAGVSGVAEDDGLAVLLIDFLLDEAQNAISVIAGPTPAPRQPHSSHAVSAQSAGCLVPAARVRSTVPDSTLAVRCAPSVGHIASQVSTTTVPTRSEVARGHSGAATPSTSENAMELAASCMPTDAVHAYVPSQVAVTTSFGTTSPVAAPESLSQAPSVQVDVTQVPSMMPVKASAKSSVACSTSASAPATKPSVPRCIAPRPRKQKLIPTQDIIISFDDL